MKCSSISNEPISRETSQIWQYVLQPKGAIFSGLIMALDGLEPVEKCRIKIEGENTPLSINVTVLSVGTPTTSDVVATTAIVPRIIASIVFVILISPY